MDHTTSSPAGRTLTVAELRKLPPAERDVILAAAAAEAEHDYRSDPSLTDFEAFDLIHHRADGVRSE